jgi:hypothetical protein
MSNEPDIPAADESEESADRRIIKRIFQPQALRHARLQLRHPSADRGNDSERRDVQIIDNATKEDKTDVTLAPHHLEELRNKPRAIPIPTLKALIESRRKDPHPAARGAHRQAHPAGKDEAEATGSSPPVPREDDDMSQTKESKGLRATFEQWQSAIDERIRAVMPNFCASASYNRK